MNLDAGEPTPSSSQGDGPSAGGPTPAFFVAGGTGISAETLGNMILGQFPTMTFTTRKIPFVKSVELAREAVAVCDAAASEQVTPLLFSTVADDDIRAELMSSKCAFIDLFGSHLDAVERVLHVNASHHIGTTHGIADQHRYEARMKAIDYSMEHDDAQSLRALDQADLILLAPSRCGKTPTSMYLALQHGLKVANYPLVEEDFASGDLPRPVREYRDRCYGLVSTPQRLAQVRSERRPNSQYATLAQCSYELRRADALFRAHRIPVVSSATMSVEEIAALILANRDKTNAGRDRRR